MTDGKRTFIIRFAAFKKIAVKKKVFCGNFLFGFETALSAREEID